MKKKRKISYSELAKDQAPGTRGQAEGTAPKATAGARGQPEGAAPKPEPDAKPVRPAKPRAPKVVAEAPAAESPAAEPPRVVAPEPVPAAKPQRRVSSPVEIAAVLRASGPHALPVVPEPAKVAAPAAAELPSAQPPRLDITASVEDYATALARRLAAMAPPEIEETEETTQQSGPLRDRVRAREGLADLLMFRIGPEIFATELAAVEEAVSLPEIHHLPEMPAAMLGAFNLRGRLTPVYSPAHVIGVPLAGAAQAALLVRANGRRLGLAVDDVEDVFQVDLATIREAPGIDDTDGILLGVAHHGQDLVAVLDAEALVAACLTGHVMETA